MDWDKIRNNFPALREVTYLNTASTGLLCTKAIDAAKKFLNERKYGGAKWLEWYNTIDKELRNKVARLLNCSITEIGFVPNTSMGINMIAHSIKWRKNGNVVTTDLEFPTNLFPWQVVARINSLEIRYARNRNRYIPIEEFEAKVDEDTRAIVVSWVEFANGFVNNLEALSKIARKYGAYLIVDGIQGVGAIPLDLSKVEINVLICGFQKWLLGTGGGFIYINRKILDELEVCYAGWLADERPFDYSFREFRPVGSAKRYELGTPSFIDFQIASVSIGMILRLGIERIYERNRRLINYLRERLSQLGDIEISTPEESISSILMIKHKGHKDIIRELLERKVVVSCREGGIRISPHFYNNEGDIDTFIINLKKILEE